MHTVLLTQYEQTLHAAFRQQRSGIRRAVADAVHRTINHQARRVLESPAARSPEALLPPVETVPLPSTTTSTSQIERTPRRRVRVIPTLEDESDLINFTFWVRYQADSSPSSERYGIPMSDSLALKSSYQAYTRVLHRERRRIRQAERLERGITLRDLITYDGQDIVDLIPGGSVIFFGGGTLLLQAVQLIFQVKQIF